ncbi:hypothetical protein [Rhodopirellula sallentina]|uniref:Uncharacterized protein n=1 Tax=Rhodopirellula sallentina SM41 TaxID=1263870 RepID=M5TXE2_9BACT|nr:hypothetical protein [Rhodopirellula sallentina]EMI53897.1 hypothetical protein RSSM_04644 [Rhodopirellula sallentina SM41]
MNRSDWFRSPRRTPSGREFSGRLDVSGIGSAKPEVSKLRSVPLFGLPKKRCRQNIEAYAGY